MRELTTEEIDHVTGGTFAYGTGPNGIFSVRNIAAATRFTAGTRGLRSTGNSGSARHCPSA